MNFLEGISNWNNHRPLLLLALENTKGDVLEMGMGDGSTPYLHDYLKKTNRILMSLDNNEEYYNKFLHWKTFFHSIMLVRDWDVLQKTTLGLCRWGVVLIDHAPAERRHVDAIALKDSADIIVIHDAEHEGMACDVYHIDKIIEHYKYRLDLVIPQHAAKTIMLSNKIDVSKFEIPKFKIA